MIDDIFRNALLSLGQPAPRLIDPRQQFLPLFHLSLPPFFFALSPTFSGIAYFLAIVHDRRPFCKSIRIFLHFSHHFLHRSLFPLFPLPLRNVPLAPLYPQGERSEPEACAFWRKEHSMLFS